MDAQAHGYAVGAFNGEDMEMIQAGIAAAEADFEEGDVGAGKGTVCFFPSV